MASSTAEIGQRRSYDGALCTVRYIGEVAGTKGSWLGVEWDDPSRGKHDGQHQGVRYFSCKSKSPTAASFVRPTRPADAPHTFISALQLKYVGDTAAPDQGHTASEKRQQQQQQQIYFSNKVAEEVGFDKIRRQQAQLGALKIVILDGACVAYSSQPPGQKTEKKEQSIREICPKVTELDLSRSLFEHFATVLDICSELVSLRSLRVNGNRFRDVLQDGKLSEPAALEAFKGVHELGLEENMMEWHEICHVASRFKSLTSLSASANHLSLLSPIPPTASFTSTLVSLTLEDNDFTSLADLACLTAITTLRNLHLKENRISSISSSTGQKAPVFSINLHYLDVSYNQIASWSFIDALPDSFPGLTGIRIAHNPVYDNPEVEETVDASLAKPTTEAAPGQAGDIKTAAASGGGNDESYMLVLGRLPTLKMLNFSTVTLADRTNAEMFYLSRIGRQLAAVPEADAQKVLARHRRWAELCEVYGEPAIVRQADVNPNFLEARLIGVHFYCTGQAAVNHKKKKEAVTSIPKSFDIYAVKGIAGRLFGLPPLKLKLVWETGEWDPVAGFDDEVGDSSEEEELEAERERQEVETREKEEESESEPGKGGAKGGRWVKREVELKDGPRQLGYCVDGPEVRIRVELR